MNWKPSSEKLMVVKTLKGSRGIRESRIVRQKSHGGATHI